MDDDRSQNLSHFESFLIEKRGAEHAFVSNKKIAFDVENDFDDEATMSHEDTQNLEGETKNDLYQYGRDPLEILREFEDARDFLTIDKYKTLLFRGIVLMAISILSIAVCEAAYYSTEISLAAYRAFKAIFYSTLEFSFLILTLIPPEQLDIDVVTQEQVPVLRYIICIFGLLVCTLQAGLPPYLGYLLYPICILMIFSKSRLRIDNFTHKLTAYAIVLMFEYDCFLLSYAFTAKYRSVPANSLNYSKTLPIFPSGLSTFPFYTICFLYSTAMIGFVTIQWYRCLQKPKKNNGLRTKAFYIIFYGFLIHFGGLMLILSIGCFYFDANPPEDDITFDRGTWTGYQSFLLGIAFCLPIAIIYLSQKTCRKYLSFPYNRRMTKLERDGMFLLGMLESRDVKVNKKFWIHFDKCKPPRLQRIDYAGTHKLYWFEGRIDKVEINKNKIDNNDEEENKFERNRFRVALVDDYLRRWYRLTAGTRLSTAVIPYEGEDIQWVNLGVTHDAISLLEAAKQDIRYSVMETLPEVIFRASWRDINEPPYYAYSYSTHGEMIDYFISHSWSDNHKLKHARLQELRDRHVKEYGTEPTFWFDKSCTPQSNIGVGLKVLPAHIMACRNFVVLCGRTYADRLWCVWELFTHFACSETVEDALSRLIMAPIEVGADDFVLSQLQKFSLSNVHCYDPNEEARLKRVIQFHDEAEFRGRVVDIAERIAVSTGKINKKDGSRCHWIRSCSRALSRARAGSEVGVEGEEC